VGTKRILTLTHSTPSRDPRILREARALASTGDFEVDIVGFTDDLSGAVGWQLFSANRGMGFRVCEFVKPNLDSFASKIFFRTRHSRSEKPLVMSAVEAWRGSRAHRVLGQIVAGFVLQGPWFSSQLGSITDTKDYDFVHCHDWVLLFAGRKISRRTGAKLIYDSHELATRRNLQTRSNRLVVSIVERISWPHVDLFISVSQSIVDFYLRRYGWKTSLVVVNTPEVRGENTPRRVGTVRTRSGCSQGDVLAVYVGGFSSGRGIDAILEAAKLEVRGLHFTFLGSGPLRGAIALAAEELGNVSIIEPVNGDQVVGFLRDADVGLCLIESVTLSYEYSLPNKLFESLFAGLRVVAYPRKEIAEVLEEVGGGVLVEQTAPEEIVRACFAASALRPAKTEALELYSLSRVGHNLVEAYRRLGR